MWGRGRKYGGDRGMCRFLMENKVSCVKSSHDRDQGEGQPGHSLPHSFHISVFSHLPEMAPGDPRYDLAVLPPPVLPPRSIEGKGGGDPPIVGRWASVAIIKVEWLEVCLKEQRVSAAISSSSSSRACTAARSALDCTALATSAMITDDEAPCAEMVRGREEDSGLPPLTLRCTAALIAASSGTRMTLR